MTSWKRWLVLGMIAVGVVSACSGEEQGNIVINNDNPVPAGPMTVADAVASGVARMTVTGGGLTEVRVSLTSERDVQIELPVGTLMISGDGASQNMMTAQSVHVDLHGTPGAPDTDEITIAAYCVNYHLEIPTGTTGFSLASAGQDRPELRALAECLENLTADHQVKQQAIWAISDRFAHMTIEQYVEDALQRARAEVAALTPDQAADRLQQVPGVDPGLIEQVRRLPPAEVARLLAAIPQDGQREQALAEFRERRRIVRPLLEQCHYDVAALPMFAATEPDETSNAT